MKKIIVAVVLLATSGCDFYSTKRNIIFEGCMRSEKFSANECWMYTTSVYPLPKED